MLHANLWHGKDRTKVMIKAEPINVPIAYHCCDYSTLRTELVSTAMLHANAVVPEINSPDKSASVADKWNLAFATEMDRLAEPLLRQSFVSTKRAAEKCGISITWFRKLASEAPEIEPTVVEGLNSAVWTPQQVEAVGKRKKS